MSHVCWVTCSKKTYLFFKNCVDKKWCEAVIFHIKNKKIFREILLDLMNFCNVTSEVLTMYYLEEFEGIVHFVCNVIFDEVKKDDISFYERLIDACFEEC